MKYFFITMVYYFTSCNVILLKNIIKEYDGSLSDISPTEYMKIFVEKYSDQIDDSKMCWIIETFLDISKHDTFLKEVTSSFASTLQNEDKDYLVIILHAIIFQILPTDITSFYKCLFNLSKAILNTLVNSLKNDDFIIEISQKSQSIYDANYISEKIVKPLLSWQPFMNEMAIKYAEFLKQMESNKIKPLTVPIQPNVLNRTSKQKHKPKLSQPATPPNSVLGKSKRMVTKSAIDEKLKLSYDYNKQKAMKLLNEVKNKTCYEHTQNAQDFSKTITVQNKTDQIWEKPLQRSNQRVCKKSSIDVKETAAMLKRFDKRIKITEQEEIQWLQDLINDCRNTHKISELEEYDRMEKERERVIDIEKKHLLGQITFEEAVLAKKRVQEENKRKYEEVLRQKELWNKEIERWNTEQMENNRKIFEKLSIIELNIIEAKEKAISKNKKKAFEVKEESKTLLLNALKNKQDELERKIQMIKEIKILDLIAKRAKIPKIVDLTETSGLGLLCEMSIAELQERLSSIKITLKEELDIKSKLIKEKNFAAKNELEQTKAKISNFMEERKKNRKKCLDPNKSIDVTSKELNDLKKILEEKRKLRLELTS